MEKTSNDTVYKSSLMGNNDAALEKLSDYIIEGNIDIKRMNDSNTCVLFVPQYVEGAYRQRFYKNAQKVMDYQVGDIVTVKIRDNYTEDMEQYWKMEDQIGSHEEQFEIDTIVYYPYLPNTSAMGLVNPDVIISAERMSYLTGQQICRVVNIQTDQGQNLQNYAMELSNLFSSTGAVTVSDLASARIEQQMRDQIYAVVGNLWSLLVGIGFASCGIIGVKHHLLQRKKDLLLCRMIGFSKKTLQADAAREDALYFVWIMVFTLGAAFALQHVIFIKSGMKVMGLPFWGVEYQKVVLLCLMFVSVRLIFVKNTCFMMQGEIMAGDREE